MKIDIPDFLFPMLIAGGAIYTFWHYWYYCVQKGDRICPAIYPPPPDCAPVTGLPFYLPRPPPFLPNPGCGFPCSCDGGGTIPPPVCQADPMCPAGSVVNPMTCQCVTECYIVANAGAINLCPQGSRWNWCVKGCVPAGSLIPDCSPPSC
jgi:hypothetical protein